MITWSRHFISIFRGKADAALFTCRTFPRHFPFISSSRAGRDGRLLLPVPQFISVNMALTDSMLQTLLIDVYVEQKRTINYNNCSKRRKIFKKVIRTETFSSLNVVNIFSNLEWRGESSLRRFFTCTIVAYYLSSAVFKRDRP